MNRISALAIPVMIALIIGHGLVKRINVFESFSEGAKSGLESMFGIVPPLIGLVVGISMLRASGVLEIITKCVSPLTEVLGMPSEVLPLAMLRPVSGSASIAVISDIFENCGPDSLAGRIASVMAGSTETTFYTIAVYFGAVGIRNARYTAKAALAADFAGMAASVVVVGMLF